MFGEAGDPSRGRSKKLRTNCLEHRADVSPPSLPPRTRSSPPPAHGAGDNYGCHARAGRSRGRPRRRCVSSGRRGRTGQARHWHPPRDNQRGCDAGPWRRRRRCRPKARWRSGWHRAERNIRGFSPRTTPTPLQAPTAAMADGPAEAPHPAALAAQKPPVAPVAVPSVSVAETSAPAVAVAAESDAEAARAPTADTTAPVVPGTGPSLTGSSSTGPDPPRLPSDVAAALPALPQTTAETEAPSGPAERFGAAAALHGDDCAGDVVSILGDSESALPHDRPHEDAAAAPGEPPGASTGQADSDAAPAPAQPEPTEAAEALPAFLPVTPMPALDDDARISTAAAGPPERAPVSV